MTAAPERSTQQRLDALVHANEVRSYRSDLKAKIAQARMNADEVLVSGDPLLATMRVDDLIKAVPGLGPRKADYMFRRYEISPSKTIAGLTSRQRGTLLVLLRKHRDGSNLYRERRRARGDGGPA